MSKICPSCKLRYDDTSMFCAECGAVLVNEQPAQYTEEASPQYSPQSQYAVSEDQAQYTAPETQPLYQYQQQQYQYQQYQPAPAIEAPAEKLYPAVSTTMYFWLNIAMAIPFVGFILSIVLTCAPKNRSLKNYARAYLIANLIIIGIFVTLWIIAMIAGAGLRELIYGLYDTSYMPY